MKKILQKPVPWGGGVHSHKIGVMGRGPQRPPGGGLRQPEVGWFTGKELVVQKQRLKEKGPPGECRGGEGLMPGLSLLWGPGREVESQVDAQNTFQGGQDVLALSNKENN